MKIKIIQRSCVSNCSSVNDGNHKISYHKFPKNKDICNHWLEKIQLTSKINLNNMYVCSRHFDDYFFIQKYSSEGKLNNLIRFLFVQFKKQN